MSGEIAHRGLAAAVMLCMVLGGVGLWIGPGFSENGAYEGADGHASVIDTGSAPVFLAEPKDPKYATHNVTVNFTAVVQDADNDVLNVTWDWGDGSINVTKTTTPTYPFCSLKLGHVYAPDPEQGRGWYMYPYYILFNLTIYLDDGNDNNVSCRTLVNVSMPFINGLPVRPTIHLNGTTSPLIDPADTVYVVANSSDPEGESMTWTYVFTNVTDVVYRTVVMNTPATAPGENVWVNVSHSFGTIGLHKIEVFVSDALVPYQMYPHNATNTIYVNVDVNHKPCASNINVNPNTPILNVTRGYVFANYSIEAYDQDGDPLTITWDFGDGSPPEVNVSEGGTQIPYTFSQTRIYTEAGWKNVSVVITDGRPGHEVFRNVSVFVNSTNLPPSIRKFYPLDLGGRNFAWVGEVIEFELVISDPEADPLEVIIDWGDGSPLLWFNITDYVGQNVTAYIYHTYLSRGNYTITIIYTDNQIGILNHAKMYLFPLEVREPGEIPEFGSMLPVALVLIIVFIASASAARRGRF